MKVLITDKLSESGVKILKEAKGLEIIDEPGVGKDRAKLKKAIATADAIAIRSETVLDAEVLAAAKNLKIIGRAGIGVDNVDVTAASKQGIIVMNTPTGNAITTAEHAIALMCALTRRIPQACASLKSGKWEKTKFMGAELHQKTLGIIGCGNIGKIVANRALGLKMKVVAFDPFLSDEVAAELGVTKVDLESLLRTSDYITLHTPLNEKTKNLIDRQNLQKMKKGVYLINCARGGIVNEKDLLTSIDNGTVAGAGLDVFEMEPLPENHPLLKSEKVICTPHLGASTEEAQENVSVEVAKQIVDYLLNGNIVNAVNTVNATADLLKKLGPSIKLGQKLGSLQGQLCTESPQEININYYGEIAVENTDPITTAILQGVLQPMLSDDVIINPVNAPYLAKERGLRVKVSKISSHSDYLSLIEVALVFKDHAQSFAGSIFGKENARVVRCNNMDTEFNPQGHILIIENNDVPGVVGKIGTFLGEHNINISTVELCLDEAKKMATAFYAVQGNVSDGLISGLKKLSGICSVRQVNL